MRNLWRWVLCGLIPLVSLVVTAQTSEPPVAVASSPGVAEKRHVVVLTTYQYGLPSPDAAHRAILAAFREQGVSLSDIFVEHLDMVRAPSAAYRATLASLLRQKLAGKSVGIVMVEGAPAIDFVSQEGRLLFPDAVLLSYGNSNLDALRSDPRQVMDFPFHLDLSGTLRAALSLLPKTQRVLVVTGARDGVIPFMDNARNAFAPWQKTLAFEYTNTMRYEEMLQRVATLPPDSLILYSPYFSDTSGRAFVPAEVSAKIGQIANAPVFTTLEVFMGRGIVGGSLLKNESSGREVGKTALDYLSGRLQLSQPITSFETPKQLTFDWQELLRWKVDPARLPDGSVVINRPVTLWGQYQGAVLTAVAVFLLLTALIATLWRMNRRLARMKLAASDSEERMRSFFDNVPVGIFIATRAGQFMYVNPVMPAMLGYDSGDELVSAVNRTSMADTLHADVPGPQALGPKRARTSSRWQTVENRYRRKDGQLIDVILSTGEKTDHVSGESLLFGVVTDITARKEAEKKIEELAFFDSLTHLPNRTLLRDRLKQAMTASSRTGAPGAVLFIDLDHFKTLNDTLGHDQGDLLLQQVAQRLAVCVRAGDTVARLGGDEFVVVLGNLHESLQEAARETEVVGEKMLAALARPYLLGALDHRSTASIGATLFCGLETSLDDLLKQADLAMYQSKASGRNALRFFDPAMQTVVIERAALETGLRRAIQEQQFVLHYQAQVVGEGRVTGAEVLLRWQHPERGMVSPAEFIPLAEDTGLILPLGRWVLETACAQLAQWAGQPALAALTLAVNVSAHQFRQPDFVAQVLDVLQRSGAKPQRLKLELTESLLVANVNEVIEKMCALKARGVGFSLDDFGTGYSSLSYLKRLPLDQLKIDQSFVRDVLSDANDASIARTIIALAKNLGLGVIAEGVETALQRDFLADAGCHAYQGYFFSRPLPVGGFEALARQHG